MVKAAIYARYSSEKQNEQSIEGQLRACYKYAKSNNMEVFKEYIDRAMTGTNDRRPAFQDMLKASYLTDWDVLLVYKLDRFSRDKVEATIHKHTLRMNGKRIVSVMENIPDTPEGIILESVLEGFNEYYSKELSQKIKRGNHESRLKGIYTMGKPPFGYDTINKHLRINKDQAETVRTLFKLVSEGYTYTEVAQILNKYEELNKSHRVFDKKLVEKIFINKHYTGILEFNGFIYDKVYPPIMTQEEWDNAHKNRRVIKRDVQHTYTKDYSNSQYLLMPKVYCGNCKRRIETSSGTSSSGRMLRYYACKNHKKGESTCGMKSIPKDLLEDVVFRALKNILKKEELIDKMATELYRRRQDTSYLTAEVTELLHKKEETEKLIEALNQSLSLTNSEAITKNLVMLNRQLLDINAQIERSKNKEFEDIALEDMKAFMKYLVGKKDKDDEKFRRNLSKHFINYVIVYPNKIVVSIRGFAPISSELTDVPDFENIDKCLIFQDKRRKVTDAERGSPKGS